MCAGDFRGQKSWNRIELSWCIQDLLIFFIWVSSAGGRGAGWWGYLGLLTLVHMSSGVLRGKESSNRIELSQ